MPEEVKDPKQSISRPKKVQKVCIVEDDIKLTEEEKEVLKEMLAEKQADELKSKTSPAKQ